jgi:hypothetical protein
MEIGEPILKQEVEVNKFRVDENKKTLSKPCAVCSSITFGAKPYYSEFVKNKETGKGHLIQHYICCHCSGDIDGRIKSVLPQVFPRAMREGFYHKVGQLV